MHEYARVSAVLAIIILIAVEAFDHCDANKDAGNVSLCDPGPICHCVIQDQYVTV